MLPALVAQTPVGDTVKVTLFRNGKKKEVSVTVAKLDEDDTNVEMGQESVLGLTVQQLTPELAQSLKIKDKEGVIVANVEPGSAAEEAGLRPGDLILEVNRQEVKNVEEYTKAIASLDKKESILLLVKRDKHTRFVVLEQNSK